MTREDSLAFLEKCLNEVKNASEEEIEKLRKVYEKNCSTMLASDEFEFVTPTGVDNKDVEVTENIDLTISKKDIEKQNEKMFISYNKKQKYNNNIFENVSAFIAA